jgi:DNA (cytosine-5)-methyltransferase 1
VTTYYNEFDPFAADWLQALIRHEAISVGTVDRRSVVEVKPADLEPYRRCHFFAGIGGWDEALQLAGWPADVPVWTASLPCQPFSAAGKQRGTDDERHLWPTFRDLVEECRPPILFGEQVPSPAGRNWLDTVRTDLEALGYAVGAADLCAAGAGAPHLRQRLYWVAHSLVQGLEGHARDGDGSSQPRRQPSQTARPVASSCGAGGLAHADRYGRYSGQPGDRRGQESSGSQYRNVLVGRGELGGLADAGHGAGFGSEPRTVERGLQAGACQDVAVRPGPVNSVWRDADWLSCRDGKWRPVEPCAFPLAPRVPARVGRLRGYGNSIVPQLAAEFIQAALEAIRLTQRNT